MAILGDNGTRTIYEKGATRESPEGKGRCDLLPWQTIGDILARTNTNKKIYPELVAYDLDLFIQENDDRHLHTAIEDFCKIRDWDVCTAMLEVSHQYEDGARKYAARNWENGLPISGFISSGGRHYLKWLRGDQDEPHDRAFIWNMLGAIWTLTNKPEFNDMAIENVPDVDIAPGPCRYCMYSQNNPAL